MVCVSIFEFSFRSMVSVYVDVFVFCFNIMYVHILVTLIHIVICSVEF